MRGSKSLVGMLALVGTLGCATTPSKMDLKYSNRYRTDLLQFDYKKEKPFLDDVYATFDPAIERSVRSVSIYRKDCKGKLAGQAYSRYNYILLCQRWDEDAAWEKRDTLGHELLHIIEKKKKIDVKQFYKDIRSWYFDLKWTHPPTPGIITTSMAKTNFHRYFTPKGNKLVYNSKRSNVHPGVEAFAVVGAFIIAQKTPAHQRELLNQLPKKIVNYYEGIIHPDILSKRTNTCECYEKKYFRW